MRRTIFDTKQKKINDFVRQYVDRSQKIVWDSVRVQLKNGLKHHLGVSLICYWLAEMEVPFATEVKLKSGHIVDILCPSHIKPIIEYRITETKKKFAEKISKLPIELVTEVIEVDKEKIKEGRVCIL